MEAISNVQFALKALHHRLLVLLNAAVFSKFYDIHSDGWYVGSKSLLCEIKMNMQDPRLITLN